MSTLIAVLLLSLKLQLNVIQVVIATATVAVELFSHCVRASACVCVCVHKLCTHPTVVVVVDLRLANPNYQTVLSLKSACKLIENKIPISHAALFFCE